MLDRKIWLHEIKSCYVSYRYNTTAFICQVSVGIGANPGPKITSHELSILEMCVSCQNETENVAAENDSNLHALKYSR